ncbi:MAG: hypothetical protein C4278_00445 [Patescibacteria group bacterium]
MKFLVQRVKDLEIENLKIKEALLIYVGIEKGDENKNLKEIVSDLINKEIIEKDGKFVLKIKEVNLPIVLISQITLIASFSKKGKISFDNSLERKKAIEIFEKIKNEFQNQGLDIYHFPFGSYLFIKNINIGPNNFYFSF